MPIYSLGTSEKPTESMTQTSSMGDELVRSSLLSRLHDSKLILWWSIAWGIGVMALSPIVNFITPLEGASYANQWTPDIYWRLVMYWHGGIFIPWIVVLSVLVVMAFKLDRMGGISERLIKESIFIGGFFAVPVAGVAGIFDVYDRYALGIPLWSQIAAFVIADEIAIALVVSMANRPRTQGGYRRAGLPFYTIMFGVVGALTAAVMGHVGGWITWFGPTPAPVAQYINSTMTPVLGYPMNSSSVIAFTVGVVGSHSHLMIVALMAGVVALAAVSFGYYENWSGNPKRVANFGFAIMILALVASIWIYVVSGVGNFQIPSFFTSGMNGVAGDDMVTGAVGFGAFFVLLGLLAHSRTGFTSDGRALFKDPLFLAVIVSWVAIYLVIPVTGFYINFNENFYKASGITFDLAFNRFHQDFGFFVLPALVTVVLAMHSFGISGRIRHFTGYLLIAGILMAFVFGETYTLSTAPDNTSSVGQVYTWIPLGTLTLDLAILGGVLMAVGSLVAALYVRRSSSPT